MQNSHSLCEKLAGPTTSPFWRSARANRRGSSTSAAAGSLAGLGRPGSSNRESGFSENDDQSDQLRSCFRPASVHAQLAVKDEYTFAFLDLEDAHSEIGEFEPEYIGKMQFYLSVLDDTVRLPEEQSSIGIILCKSKDRLIVEYALKDATLPIGVSSYSVTPNIPSRLQGQLPSAEQIASLLAGID
jgi:hypothetical protein